MIVIRWWVFFGSWLFELVRLVLNYEVSGFYRFPYFLKKIHRVCVFHEYFLIIWKIVRVWLYMCNSFLYYSIWIIYTYKREWCVCECLNYYDLALIILCTLDRVGFRVTYLTVSNQVMYVRFLNPPN